MVIKDCQIFFVRSYQIPLLKKLRVNNQNPYCYSNLAQLHVQSPTSLLLVFMQTGNRVCTLEVQIPSQQMIFGDHIFSYSLLASLPYASCSHSSRDSVQFLPDLSYMDTVYKDVIYFIDPRSKDKEWTVHQFKLSPDGFLKYLTKLNITNYAHLKSTPASEYMVALDIQRKFLYKYNKQDNSLHYECSYDSLFRKDHVKSHRWNLADRPLGLHLNGFAAEKHALIFSEIDRTASPPVSRIYSRNNKDGSQQYTCLGEIPFSFDIGILKYSSLADMSKKPLMSIGDKKLTTKRPPSKLAQHRDKEKSTTLGSTAMTTETGEREVGEITQTESYNTIPNAEASTEQIEIEDEYDVSSTEKEPEEIGRILKTDDDEMIEEEEEEEETTTMANEERTIEGTPHQKGNVSSLHNENETNTKLGQNLKLSISAIIIYAIIIALNLSTIC
ncbi:hypothetical protein WR25_15472 [Diploscapter pachys]|uniref:Uncharacterized protein n=1 Tax=Diploscapter pachys TaxID=2018661 RepID=A0A2A2L4G5_9BILA|nr:hypothetical protein WR25_15472 [Diploscapter pachys]